MMTRSCTHIPATFRVAILATAWTLVVAGLSSASAATVGYWRFEEGSNGALAQRTGSVLDTSGLDQHGTPYNNPVYTNAVPVGRVAQTGQTNTLSLSFDGQWHHLAGTYDGLNAEFFVDGISQGTHAVGTYVGNTREIRIGNTRQLSRYFAGEIDELRISHAVLKTEQFLNVLPGFSISVLTDGGESVTVNGLAGWRYTLERRESLTEGTWQPVAGQTEILCVATGPLLPTAAAVLLQAFYRVVAEAP